jgi:hypothetical protein
MEVFMSKFQNILEKLRFHTKAFGLYADHGNFNDWYINLRIGRGAGYAHYFWNRRYDIPWFTFYIARNCVGGPRKVKEPYTSENSLSMYVPLPWQIGVTNNGNGLPYTRH